MKNLKKLLAILLVASMILTTNATTMFASETNQETEEQIEETEEIVEETEANEEEESLEEEELSEPEEETTVEANEVEEEQEEETLKLENKKENKSKLYGEDPGPNNVEILYFPWQDKYYTPCKFNPSGLAVRATYGDVTNDFYWDDPDHKALFDFDPSLDEDLQVGTTSVVFLFDNYMEKFRIPITVKEGTPLYGDNTFYMIMSKSTSVGLDENGYNREDLNVHYHDIKIPVPSGKQALGWYRIHIDGMNTINQIYDEYDSNYDDKQIVTLDEAFNSWDPAASSVAYGLVLKNKDNPNVNPYNYEDDNDGDGSSDPNVGPMGRQYKELDYGNGFPSLKDDLSLLLWLMSFPENMNRPKTVARDIYGNVAYGRWLHVPGTMTWYFFVGDFDANGIKPNSGFIVAGLFKLEWNGKENWFRFDASGVMLLGWYSDGIKIYFLQNDPTDPDYGEQLIGVQIIDGVEYHFDTSGALIQ